MTEPDRDPKTVLLHFRVSEALAEQARAAAKKQGIGTSAWLRNLVEAQVAPRRRKRSSKPAPTAAASRAKLDRLTTQLKGQGLTTRAAMREARKQLGLAPASTRSKR